MQRHSVTSHETVRSLADGSCWGGGLSWVEKYVFCVPLGIAASPISLLSMGGVCGRSLTAGKFFLHLKANMLPLFSIMTLWLTLPLFPRFRGRLHFVERNRRGRAVGAGARGDLQRSPAPRQPAHRHHLLGPLRWGHALRCPVKSV